jgi:phosphoglycerate dehydrogenase-like enzyme
LLALVGLGASGRELASRARALAMRVRAVGLDALLAESHFVSFHVPLTSATRHLIDERRLAVLKPTTAPINVACGRIVDEGALARALSARTIAGAGIDVFGEEPLTPANPMLALDNVITTPHTAGVTRGTSRRRSRAFIENAVRVLRGEVPLFQVYASA